MSQQYSSVVKTAQDYYNSDDADRFYYHIWGGQDIHIGLYQDAREDIGRASKRTVETMLGYIQQGPQGSERVDFKAIDLGSGYGGAARAIADNCHCPVTCINLSEAQNARNRSLSDAAGLSKLIEVVDASFEDIPCPDGTFDLAWSQDAILHSGNRARVFDEIDRVLKPGGELVFTDPMQADDCPDGVLQPVLARIHLDTLGSFAFYREQARRLGWGELHVEDLTHQLVRHYTRVRDELEHRRDELAEIVSADYIERMTEGLGHWIEAGEKGYLAWGIMHFHKPL